jgi:4-hydroxybenzoate polyprenyltransferase
VANLMSSSVERAAWPSTVALFKAAHFGPTLAVTVLVALLTTSFELTFATASLVTAAVFTGQLTIGWANDLLDRDRDRQSGRTDKPLASGEIPVRLVLASLCVAAGACVLLSFSVGWRSAVVHLFLGLASGHAYNLGLKSTTVSWLPYAIAFGTLPAVVSLAGSSPELPPWWMVTASAALGVAAHFLNTLPDFEDDAATGVRGLPHRLGQNTSRLLATMLLLSASGIAAFGPGSPPPWSWVVLSATVALGAVALLGRGKRPFYAAIAIAFLDVALLTGRA